MENFNNLEKSIISRIISKYPILKAHIPHLKILDREYTGVGMYVNFIYDDTYKEKVDSTLKDLAISTNEIIEIKSLKHGLCYEFFIKDSKIKYLELVAIGEEWDGVIPNEFKFI